MESTGRGGEKRVEREGGSRERESERERMAEPLGTQQASRSDTGGAQEETAECAARSAHHKV